MQNYILYQITKPHQVNECRYALLKLLEVYNLHPTNFSVILHTNQPASFEAFAPFFNGFHLQEATGLSKSELLKKTLSHRGGAVIYLNTNTFLTQPIEPLFQHLENNTCIVYKKEAFNSQSNSVERNKLKTLLETWIRSSGKAAHLSLPDQIFTTEVLGINKGMEKHFPSIEDLCKQLGEIASSRAVEEFALSYVLKNETVETSHSFISSYQYFPEAKPLLQQFFERNEEESIPNQMKRMHYLNLQTVLDEKRAFDQLHFLKKWLLHLTGKGWSVRQYQNKF